MLKFRVITYNVFGFRMLRRFSVKHFAEALAPLDADIIALQEVDEGRLVQRKPSPVKSLAAELGMKLVFHPVYSPQQLENSFGNAILSKGPLHKKNEGFLPGKTWRTVIEPRGVIQAEVEWMETKIQILNTHLTFWPHHQRRQVRSLSKDWLAAAGGNKHPVVLMGDFNLGPRSSAFKNLPDYMTCANGERIFLTWPSQKPWRQLDYIWTNSLIKTTRCFVPEEPLFRRLSDHLPVAADLDVSTQKDAARHVV